MLDKAASDTVETVRLAKAILDSARWVMPHLVFRHDIVELGVYTMEAYALLDSVKAACNILHDIGPEAERVPKLRKQIGPLRDSLACP